MKRITKRVFFNNKSDEAQRKKICRGIISFIKIIYPTMCSEVVKRT